ncbi:methyltransferase [Bradyrhizobium diazoefficiens]|nr:methyltransferase [Bradyrhizobium diazoefficiens]UCF53708.1 MAG: methyltransferase [Bradyrhizobium sp.]MBR0982070.1 methyltransferase [Bradyrhizobium diazoefficiens]MBR1008521.1 methyltransferase [Bradyrhizobium diazoefficiens]MBR1017969.1 methyltransferase [Bradyrhizobium diazoefficiens]
MATIAHREGGGEPSDAPRGADIVLSDHGVSRLSLHDRLLGWRDAILASPRFQRFAARFALTRPIARRRASALFDLCAGFVYSQVLFACVRLKLFDQLADGPLSSAELASRVPLPADATLMLLDAAVSLQLLQRRSDGRYGLGSLGAALRGNPGVVAMIEHHAMLYDDLRDPIALLRGEIGAGKLAAYWPYAANRGAADLPHDAIAPYTALMAASQPMISQQVLSAYSFRSHRCLLDIGGGDGSFITAVAAQAPGLRCVLFDLPAVADHASERFRAEGLSSRAVAIGGSFLANRLPEGADIVSLVRVTHDHDDTDVMTLLRAVHASLPVGGTLLIAEPISGVRGAEPIGDAYFAFYLMAMGSGRPRTFARLRGMLSEAGFADVALRPVAMPMLASVITARKSEIDVNQT